MIMHVVGVRPNYVKAAPLVRELSDKDQIVVNTGQHYDKILSDDIMVSLGMRKPDINLSIPTKAGVFERLGCLTQGLYSTMIKYNPRLVVVYGDVDSTLGAALAASRLHIPVAHVEAGLRSFDDKMPEEVNRKIIDTISSIHFATEDSAVENLQNEGYSSSIKLVGNSMIDSLVKVIKSEAFRNCEKTNNGKILMTCHRQSNVDNKYNLLSIYEMCRSISQNITFPVHPRTLKKMKDFDLYEKFMSLENLELMGPLDYCSFLKMMSTSSGVITDSGGIQEETTFLGIPCITIRENTERPSTIINGTNTLASFDEVDYYVKKIASLNYKKPEKMRLWDGQAGERISFHIRQFLDS